MDYGNEETTDISALRTLTENFSSFAPFCFSCKLGGVQPSGDDWSEETIDAFKTMVEEK